MQKSVYARIVIKWTIMVYDNATTRWFTINVLMLTRFSLRVRMRIFLDNQTSIRQVMDAMSTAICR